MDFLVADVFVVSPLIVPSRDARNIRGWGTRRVLAAAGLGLTIKPVLNNSHFLFTIHFIFGNHAITIASCAGNSFTETNRYGNYPMACCD